MSNLVVSYLRTIVPILWGSAITWALGAVSWLPSVLDYLNLDPASPAVTTAVTGLVIAAWYMVWRKVEPHVPAWLTTILLGASAAPTYDLRTALEIEADAQAARNVPTRSPYTEPH